MIRRSRKFLAPCLAAIVLTAAGCAEHVAATPVDPSRARDALKTTLDAWKKGQTVDSLKSGSPPIVAQDLEWQSGAVLADYAIAGEGETVDSNLKVPVKLTLKSPGGAPATKQVTYLVTTSPSITVFRAFP